MKNHVRGFAQHGQALRTRQKLHQASGSQQHGHSQQTPDHLGGSGAQGQQGRDQQGEEGAVEVGVPLVVLQHVGVLALQHGLRGFAEDVQVVPAFGGDEDGDQQPEEQRNDAGRVPAL